MATQPRVLYIGKFQPFHWGHQLAITKLKRLGCDITIAVGSHTDDRYFTLPERIKMIQANTGLHPVLIDDLAEDHPQYFDWGGYVLETLGDFDIIATGNRQVMSDFHDAKKDVLYFYRDKDEVSGTKIRKLIEDRDDDWMTGVSVLKDIILKSSYFQRSNS